MMLRTSALALAASAATLVAFPVEWGEQPVGHPRLTPADGATVAVNPPALIWRVDATAASYILELAQDPAFGAGAVRVEGIDLPFYNHREVLEPGTWHWRYRVVRADATVSDPSPAQRFVVPPDAVPLPVPPDPRDPGAAPRASARVRHSRHAGGVPGTARGSGPPKPGTRSATPRSRPWPRTRPRYRCSPSPPTPASRASRSSSSKAASPACRRASVPPI